MTSQSKPNRRFASLDQRRPGILQDGVTILCRQPFENMVVHPTSS